MTGHGSRRVSYLALKAKFMRCTQKDEMHTESYLTLNDCPLCGENLMAKGGESGTKVKLVQRCTGDGHANSLLYL